MRAPNQSDGSRKRDSFLNLFEWRHSTGIPAAEPVVAAEQAANSNEGLERSNSTLSHHTAASSISAASITRQSNGSPKPQRLVDFFCVLGAKQALEPSQSKQDLSTVKDPTEILLQSHLMDSYPRSRPDMEFPNHVHTFCFPNGCFVCKEKPSPTLLTLTLTSASGHRLYGACLTFHDRTIRASQFTKLLHDSGYQGTLPSWCLTEEDSETPTRHEEKKEQSPTNDTTDEYHLPKCLVVLSHYPFFDVFRKFLQQLYRIYTSGISPLPLERYIANFVDDVPLPPEGKVKISWECFTSGCMVDISRPPPNQLPLVNFSYQPLFSTLSVANILVVWGTLLKEGRVALCSKHHALLTPVAEALLSLLFPLEWQGIYIPILPSSMVDDVLDAPLPFLVGLDSLYLKNFKDRRHTHLVFVDLDEDIVHLGWDDESNKHWTPNRIPALPDRSIMELRVRLEELTDHLYLVPTCGIKGRMTTGDNDLLENSKREPFAQMTRLHDGSNKDDRNHRSFILSNAERAFVDEENIPPLQPLDFLLSGTDEKTVQKLSPRSPPSVSTRRDPNILSSLKRTTRAVQAHTDRLLAFAGQQYATPNPFNGSVSNQTLIQKRFHLATQLYELDPIDGGNDENSFSSHAVRQAFLDFFVDLLTRYSWYAREGPLGEVSFRRQAFVNGLPMSLRNKKYVSSVVNTQMFERFVHDTSRRKAFFSEQVITKTNRESLFGAAKRPTPFLDNPRWKVRKVIKPPDPYAGWSIWGDTKYSYDEFPSLYDEEFVSNNADAKTKSSFCVEVCDSSTLCSLTLCWPWT